MQIKLNGIIIQKKLKEILNIAKNCKRKPSTFQKKTPKIVIQSKIPKKIATNLDLKKSKELKENSKRISTLKQRVSKSSKRNPKLKNMEK